MMSLAKKMAVLWIADTPYTLRLTKEVDRLNGTDYAVILDEDRFQIRLGKPVRVVVAEAVRLARAHARRRATEIAGVTND